MDELMQVLARCLPRVDFSDPNGLVDRGLIDSLDMVSLVDELSDRFAIEIPPEEMKLDRFNSVDSIRQMVERLKRGS